jgi:cellulose synthase/poly-beta-1,6-N-acetylglucosamine synthase-like glycosyltransferase
MRQSNSQARAWQHAVTLRGRIFELSVIGAAIASCFLICQLTMGHSARSFVWSIVLCFYFFFYRRIAHVIYWSHNTFQFLRTQNPKEQDEDAARKHYLPTFHILIASFEAGQSIGPVLRAAAHQDYPLDKFSIWVITKRSEQLRKERLVSQLLRRAEDARTSEAIVTPLSALVWRCFSKQTASIEAWIEEVTSGNLRGHLGGPGAETVVLEDLLSRLLRAQDRTALYSSGKLAPMGFRSGEIAVLESTLQQIERNVDRILGDFARMLGPDVIYKREDLEAQLLGHEVRKRKLKRIGKRFCDRFSEPSPKPTFPDSGRIEKVVRLALISSQDMTQQIIAELPNVHIRHLDPYKRGHKPGALNAAYRTIKDERLLDNPNDVYFIIIDSDSLLPSNALSAVAKEILRQNGVPGILQMAAIPTANFFSGNWYSKFISFADAIGAVGKWARSTRKQLKPDLHAGSGVVVPASLAQFIEAKTGHAWDEGTLTEDARLIIGQFGMMNEVRNKTTAVPVYLLEAVPEGNSFLGTYKSFWNQRRRWTVGGYDEFFYMLRSPGWLRHARFNPCSRKWEVCQPELRERITARFRQTHRLALWLWDHFIWGIGGLVVLTHWWLASLMVGVPSKPVAWLGMLALLFSPLVFLAIPGRCLYWFIPGGLSIRQACLLYVVSFVAIWLYCAPVVATQLACVIGFRTKIVAWKPTAKPRYQFGLPLKVRDY